MVITVYSPIVLSTKDIERRVRKCPFIKDAKKIQVLERKSSPAISEWAEANGLKIVPRKMNREHHGKGAIFRTYKSIVDQVDAVVYLGRPQTELDHFVISRACKGGAKFWMVA